MNQHTKKQYSSEQEKERESIKEQLRNLTDSSSSCESSNSDTDTLQSECSSIKNYKFTITEKRTRSGAKKQRIYNEVTDHGKNDNKWRQYVLQEEEHRKWVAEMQRQHELKKRIFKYRRKRSVLPPLFFCF